MLIIAGTRKTEERLGYVAEVCPFCRTVSACEVRQLKEVSHLYFVPISKAKILGRSIRCRTCRKLIPGDVDAYEHIERRLRPVEELIDATNPASVERAIALLDREDHLASGMASSAERLDAIGQVFLSIAPDCEPKTQETQWGLIEVGLIIGVAVLAITAVVGFSMAQSLGSVAAGLVALLALLAVVAMLCVRVVRSGRRYMTRHHRAYIGETLAELQPTETEINAVLGALRRSEFKFARKIDAAWVMSAIGDARLASP